jgi:hypothetical protein
MGKVHLQHITKKHVSGAELNSYFVLTHVTSYSKLLVILYVWRLGCTTYMNLPVT